MHTAPHVLNARIRRRRAGEGGRGGEEAFIGLFCGVASVAMPSSRVGSVADETR